MLLHSHFWAFSFPYGDRGLLAPIQIKCWTRSVLGTLPAHPPPAGVKRVELGIAQIIPVRLDGKLGQRCFSKKRDVWRGGRVGAPVQKLGGRWEKAAARSS